MKPINKAYLQLHLAVLLWGFTAIFGKLITLDALHLVIYRMFISTIALWIFLKSKKRFHIPDKNTIYKVIGIGIIIALHWITLYAAIKISNVSIAISCFSSIALFTAVFNPLIHSERLRLSEILLSIFVIVGIFIIFSVQKLYLTGIILSVVSAALAALFSILNKSLYYKNDPGSITVIELGSGFLFLALIFPFYSYANQFPFQFPSWHDTFYLLILSIACTSLAFTLGNYALQKLDAFTCNLTVNLEPVYSIFLAIIIFHEDQYLNTGFYIGTGIILLSVVVHTVYKFHLTKRANFKTQT